MTSTPDAGSAVPPAGERHSAVPVPARVVLGVSGGIAAYKACTLLRLFKEAGHGADFDL